MKNIFIASQDYYLEPFKHLFRPIGDIWRADAVMFTGGHDVCPALYGENEGSFTQCDYSRDVREQALFKQAKMIGLPMLGICRGAQFLTVMSGGKLVQDVSNHALSTVHPIYRTDMHTSVPMSSTHHQMMHPYNLPQENYSILAYTKDRSSRYLDGEDRPIPHCGIEPEIVWYPKTRCLCIQGHPEIMSEDSLGVLYCQQLVEEFIYEKSN